MTFRLLMVVSKEHHRLAVPHEDQGVALKTAVLGQDFEQMVTWANHLVLICPEKNLETITEAVQQLAALKGENQELWLCAPQLLKRALLKKQGVTRFLEPLHWKPAAVKARVLAQAYRMIAADLRTFGIIRGASQPMQEVFKSINRIANINEPVLILGETGVGKDLAAQMVHKLSQRPGGLVNVNAAEFSANLLESELFGHVAGAFSGAVKDRTGLIVSAGRGTFFLDEIGDLSLELQAKLLRTLHNREVRPVGGNNIIRFDARLAFATHHNLEEKVARGEFREDLYYRINNYRIILPPLRERREDILLLADFFVATYNKEYHRELAIPDDCLDLLYRNDWPGNVRELQSVIYRSATFSDGRLVDRTELMEAVKSQRRLAPEDGLNMQMDPIQLNWEQAQNRLKAFYFPKLVARSKSKKEAIEISGLSKARFYEILKELKEV